MMPGAPWQAARDCGDWNDDGARYSPRVVYDVNGHKVATFYARPVFGAGSDAPAMQRVERNAAALRAGLAAMAPAMAEAIAECVAHRRADFLALDVAPYFKLATLDERLARLFAEWNAGTLADKDRAP